jgi:mRNA interferase YafQ
MRTIRRTTQFKKDVKRVQKRGKDFTEFKRVIELLVEGKPLEKKHRDHALVGNWAGTRDCHIEPDWLLLYQIDEEELILVRTGSHSDLFKK